MKKKLILLAVVAIIFLSFPSAAYANAPAPNPFSIEIAIKNYSNNIGVEILGSHDGAYFERVESNYYMQETRRKNEKILDFNNNDEKYKWFKLKITFFNGETAESNVVDFVENGSYLMMSRTIR